ncbi:MAG: rhamnulokinase family protein [Oscillospiraceae bacterium]|jgi:rhamnulokinase|nr:rhamnulokinase [Ruminococcus sp.]MDD7337747.1 rhamnulokinase [Ruminococcus sp.]MDY6061810.1 rhamnulokinase family protein [Oscillospiraceae bacterium]
MKKVLAFDFGASSGRAIIGSFDGEKITLKEVHRFTNDPVDLGGTLYWDVLRLFYEIKQGIVKAKIAGGFDSIGIDTWGVDFGLIDKNGRLLENPVHYRDKRTSGLVEESFKSVPRQKMYDITGIQFMELNTLFQLISLKKQRPEMLERADKMLFMPDLFAYFLTGKMCSEYSIASTSQLIDINTRSWSKELLDAFGIKESLFAPLTEPGTQLGNLSKEICEECGVESVPVISVCGHDTQSAITAVPCESGDFAFLSSGTWSLFGTELQKPIVNETSLKINITNEGGFGGTTGFLKNIIGLWLIQESRRQWQREGKDYSYADLEKLALSEEPFKCFIDPDAPEFVPQGNIPERVREFCRKTGQYVPESVGEIMRCIYESLAMKYRMTFEKLCECTGKDYPVIHVIGGGTKDGLLCRMTASSCGKTVKAGPIEATVMGNVAVQLMSDGTIGSISEARKAVAASESLKTYEPENTDEWIKAYESFVKIAK